MAKKLLIVAYTVDLIQVLEADSDTPMSSQEIDEGKAELIKSLEAGARTLGYCDAKVSNVRLVEVDKEG